MSGVAFPEGFRLETLQRDHQRRAFDCGQDEVTGWLRTKALQHQEKRLSVTKALLDARGDIAGFYTLATGQVDFGDLPADLVRQLPRRALPVAVLAWLGVSRSHQGRNLGNLLLAQALADCHDAGRTFPFVAVILDCVNDRAKRFYQRWDFAELPGNPYRLFLNARTLAAIAGVPDRTRGLAHSSDATPNGLDRRTDRPRRELPPHRPASDRAAGAGTLDREPPGLEDGRRAAFAAPRGGAAGGGRADHLRRAGR